MVQEMKNRIDGLYADGRTTDLSVTEIESIVLELKQDERCGEF